MIHRHRTLCQRKNRIFTFLDKLAFKRGIPAWQRCEAFFKLAAQGHGDHVPPAHLRAQLEECFTPLPSWYAPFEGQLVKEGEYPVFALTQRPMAMYHSWGSQNAWLRQIHGYNPLFISHELAEKHDLAEGDWAEVTSHHGTITVPVVVMQGVNKDTVWTWNAIGKKKGAWRLSDDAPESNKGFLLNHLIHELLPPKGDGLRWSNSDPITGQAAWYDLKVKIAKASPPANLASLPQFESPAELPNMPKTQDTVRYGLKWTNAARDKS